MAKGVAVKAARQSFVVTVNFNQPISAAKALKAFKDTFPKGYKDVGYGYGVDGVIKSVKPVLG